MDLILSYILIREESKRRERREHFGGWVELGAGVDEGLRDGHVVVLRRQVQRCQSVLREQYSQNIVRGTSQI